MGFFFSAPSRDAPAGKPTLEDPQDELAAERGPAALRCCGRCSGGVSSQPANAVAFKFGGSSLLGADQIVHAASLVREAARDSNVIVIVSAMKGITDHLLSITHALAGGRLAHARREAEVVLGLHLGVLRDLHLDEGHALRMRREFQFLGRDLLHEVPAQGCVAACPEFCDRLASFGERFSAPLFAAALEKLGVAAVPVSSSGFVLTCETFRDAQPLLEQTRQRGREILLPLLEAAIVPVVTGFIGATPDGRITTLGRNSSDNESAEARLLHELSYDEAHALAASGAKVLHAKVLPLAAETEMVVWVRNTFNPQARGTRIASPRVLKGSSPNLPGSSQQGGLA